MGFWGRAVKDGIFSASIVEMQLRFSSAKTMKPLTDKEHLNCVRAFANKLQIARASVTHVVLYPSYEQESVFRN